VEGAYQDEGKGLSIWDAFSHSNGKILGAANADVSCCHFYRREHGLACFTGWWWQAPTGFPPAAGQLQRGGGGGTDAGRTAPAWCLGADVALAGFVGAAGTRRTWPS
jgi:hypothetical protein